MDKGISFYFGFESDIDERAKKLKEFGFSSVITCADKKFNYQNGSIRKQVKIFKKYNLKFSSLHMRYNADELHFMWEEGKIGERLKRNLIKDVKIASKYGFTCVVVHLKGNYSEIGEKRLRQVLSVCEKLNIPLAIENIECQQIFLDVFKNINHKMLKFCYDVGHNNVFDKNYDYFKNFGDKLITLHLNDNNGLRDEHTLTHFSGNIDWTYIAKGLSKYNNLSLDYEVFCKKDYNLTENEYLSLVIQQAKELESLILNFKNNKKY